MRVLPALLFPREPRQLPGRRLLKILLRAIHVPAAGILTAAYLFDVPVASRETWMMATVVSGLLILALDLHETGVFLLQLRGLIVLGKLGLLAVLPWFGTQAAPLLFGLLVVSVLSSHAPSRFRYHLVFGRDRFQGAETKG